MLKFPKIFRGKKTSEDAKNDIVDINPLEHKQQNSEEQFYELPSPNEGEVTLHFTGASPANGALIVGFFVSNGMSEKVKFKSVPLVLMDSDKRVLARQSFGADVIGEVVGRSEKACVVRFRRDNVYGQDIPSDCQICFDIPAKRPQGIEIQYQSLPENISEDQQQELEKILAKLPSMKQGEVNFSPLKAIITVQNDLLTTVIIRNFSDKQINLEQIPLAVFDAHREELARGVFNIENLSIEPFKAILWTFNFGSVLQDRDIDLSSWHINIVKF
ncbi:SLAP domain-containing protein [Desulfosporosinus nitroreducens]|uniref:SLAP domain-containing protein n=1 Tax=Desulfosporosinus nitroreducens TaxID=2018668 RepID=A0ABT8QVB0_9FIRM|nr:SLAP domain-containing protein [Desulfosporosinus nitroreducens]MDO0824404.1 SLAP domain-containing protein [Desulfosporosinus nitroreducens]